MLYVVSIVKMLWEEGPQHSSTIPIVADRLQIQPWDLKSTANFVWLDLVLLTQVETRTRLVLLFPLKFALR